MVPDGAAMDALLKKYNIDPQNDMIVAAMGTGSTGNAMAQGRIWYALRYWGVDKKNLAILNGGNQWLDDDLGLPVELLAARFPGYRKHGTQQRPRLGQEICWSTTPSCRPRCRTCWLSCRRPTST